MDRTTGGAVSPLCTQDLRAPSCPPSEYLHTHGAVSGMGLMLLWSYLYFTHASYAEPEANSMGILSFGLLFFQRTLLGIHSSSRK